ncbi:MAG: ABC transporter substrate-binding protein [Chloroflexota bacterium]
MRTSSIALHQLGGALFGAGNLAMRSRQNMYQVSPYLARSWYSSPDFTEWIFFLRNDLLWHDGTPFTADDVKFWFDLALFGYKVDGKVRAPAYFKGDLDEVKEVEVLSRDHLRVKLNTRNRFLPDVLADPRLKFAHPRHLMEPRLKAGDLSASPLDIGLVGLGPFRFEDYEPGSVVRVLRFDRYFEKDEQGNRLPYLDGIDYVTMTDPAAMDAAFRTGRLDGGARGVGHYLSEERMQGYIRDLGDKVFFAEMEGGNFRLAFNVLKPGPWQDSRVRRAIALWIDKEAAIPAVLGGFGWTSPGLGPPNTGKDKRFVVWPRFDVAPVEERRAEAKRLMAEAGYAEGFVMGHLSRAQQPLGGQFLKDQLKGLGIDLQLQVVDEAQWNTGRVSLDYDSAQGALTVMPIPEGTEGVYGRFSKSPDAYAKHEDEKVDEYYRLLLEASTTEGRIDVWRQLQEYLFIEQTYIIPIAEAIYVVPYRTYVRGLPVPAEDAHTHTDFATVWLDKGMK